MSRSPVTVVIPAWNGWEATKSCLDALRPTLGVRDQVVVVDNGSTDATSQSLRQYPWAQVLNHPLNLGFARAANAGAAAARHDIVVFLHNDTVPMARWIEPIVAALDDGSVVAAGPVSDVALPGQEVLAAPFRSTADARRFARDHTAAHRGETTEASILDGFCLAVRRSSFEAADGFPTEYGLGSWESHDLCCRLAAAGRLVVVADSFVAHRGRTTFTANGIDRATDRERFRSAFAAAHPGAVLPPLVSACLIVKDEEPSLTSCLASLAGVADEIVVYDTGSTDGTVELARRLGAQVIEGYWDDDFSRARNDALAHCHGEWIAWLDADEELECDPAQLRTLLEDTPLEMDAWSVRIRNLTGAGTGSEFTHSASRLFRRARCEWAGRLHEQVAARVEHSAIRVADLEGSHINHTGYLDSVMAAKGKAARNLRVAQTEIDEADGWDKGYSLGSLGRSLVLAGQFQEGLDRLLEALENTDNGNTRRLAMRASVDALSAMGRYDEALEYPSRVVDEGAPPHTAAVIEAPIRLAQGHYQKALELLDTIVPGWVDLDGYGMSVPAYAAQRSQALAGLRRFGEAADALLSVLIEDGVLDAHLGSLVDYMTEAGRSLTDLAVAIPPQRVNLFLAQVLQLRPEVADTVLEACLAGPVDARTVLATASKLAIRLPVERAMVWSAVLRQAGFVAACPLIAIAGSDGPPVLRARAAATAKRAFGDDRAEELFLSSWAAASDDDRAVITLEAGQLCPELLITVAGAPATVAGNR
ncbi:MAG TPA: glycosyltransferase [Acidimicrobiales bacterium]|jgi:GT2 family glycosyltransferase/tetratricopeptide (TPR) repeat protein|nr:glycosyltransferase [Acidimicrobiales bacterium]